MGAACAVGCSLSTSSVSISDSVSSPVRLVSSLSESSSGAHGEEAAYRRDVAEYVEAYVRSGGQHDAFTRRLGELAKQHGISDWEADRVTYLALGEGLARAKVQGVALKTWVENLADGDPAKMQQIQEGYGGYRAP